MVLVLAQETVAHTLVMVLAYKLELQIEDMKKCLFILPNQFYSEEV